MDIVWEIVTAHLPVLKRAVEKLLQEIEAEHDNGQQA